MFVRVIGEHKLVLCSVHTGTDHGPIIFSSTTIDQDNTLFHWQNRLANDDSK